MLSSYSFIIFVKKHLCVTTVEPVMSTAANGQFNSSIDLYVDHFIFSKLVGGFMLRWIQR